MAEAAWMPAFSAWALWTFGLDNSVLWAVLCLEGLFSSSPGLYPLDARNTPLPSCGNQNCFQMLPNVPWKAELTLVENPCLGSVI